MKNINETVLKNQELMDSNLRWLFISSGIAGIIAVFIFRRNLGAEYFLLRMMGLFEGGPTVIPQTPAEWFNLFHNNVLLGLLLSDLFDVVNSFLITLLTLSLYFVHKSINKSLSAFFLMTSMFGTLLYITTNVSLSLLALSNQYFSSNSVDQNNQIISAAYALLSVHNPGSANQSIGAHLSLFFLFVSGISASFGMLQNSVFKKRTGIIGLIANGMGVTYFIFIFIDPSLLFIPLSISAPFIIVWYMIISVKLIRISIFLKGKIIK
jgi:hypothetical protein